MLVYFMAIGYILCPFVIFYGHLVISWSFDIVSTCFGNWYIVQIKIWQPSREAQGTDCQDDEFFFWGGPLLIFTQLDPSL
jgi:hypothetical protein